MAKKEKKVFLCDMDGILTNLHGALLDRYNNDFNENLKPSDIKHWELKKLFKKKENIWDYLNDSNFFGTLKPLPGAIAGLAQIHDAGALVVIATSPGRNPDAAGQKKRWMSKHADFINHRHMMIGPLKYLLKGDFFLDDSPEQQKDYRKAWPDTTILTIKYPFDPDPGVTVVAEDYSDTRKAWDTIVRETLARL